MNIKYIKWIVTFAGLVLVLFVSVGGFFLYQVGYTINDTVNKAKKELKLSAKRSKKVDIDKDPFTVLLIGTDGRSAYTHNWRPDVLMIAAINPKNKSIKMVSIPRDTYVEIANTNGAMDKINATAAYAYQRKIDPVQNIRETVEELFHIPIDYYAKVNFQGFTDIVDVLGGVDVNVPFSFHSKMIGGKMAYFEKGPAHLNGAEALAYVRMRRNDPLGDKGRNKRQREVVQQLVNKLTSLDAVTKFPELVKTVSDNFEYSFSFSEIASLSQSYHQAKDKIEEIEIKTIPSRRYIGGVYAYIEILPEEEQKRISQILQQQIEYDPSSRANRLLSK